MSRRYTATIPDSLGQVVEKIAESEGSKPATVASRLLESAIREDIDKGKYPAEWAVLEKTQSSEPSKLDSIDSEALVKLLFKLKGSKKLTATDISLLENILDLDPGRLTDLTRNGNDDAKSRAGK